MTNVELVDRGDGVRLATRFLRGRGPTILFLPGYMSDMSGGKAEHLLAFAARAGRQCLLLDYSGCGRSEGRFDDGSIRRWANDALAMADALAPGPLLVVGSSMGAWVMLHLALADPARIRALVGIAAAPDFTRWGLPLAAAERMALESRGYFTRPSPYADSPYRYSRTFLADAETACLLDGTIPLDLPVRLLHGKADEEVPPEIARRLMTALRSTDVQLTLVKDGDHRLSSPAGLSLLEWTIESLA